MRILLAISLTFILQKSSVAVRVPLLATMPGQIAADVQFASNRTKISILAGINYGGLVGALGPVCTEALRVGLNAISSNPYFLPRYELVVDVYDDECSPAIAISHFVELMESNKESINRLPLTVVPYCSSSFHIGRMLKAYNFVGLGTTSTATNLRNIFFAIDTPDALVNSLNRFILNLNWHRLAIITEGNAFQANFESRFIETFERNNGTIVGIFKIPTEEGTLPQPAMIEKAVKDMKNSDARILLMDSTVPSLITCWLYRYKFYGPNYVILAMNTVIFQSDSNITNKLPWCDEGALAEVLTSFIFFGYSNSADLGLNSSKVDTFGNTRQTFDRLLSNVVAIDSISTPYQWAWRSHCYENFMIAAAALNTTEMMLNKKNETLSDWVTGGVKFKNNPDFIVSVVREAVSLTTVRTLDGDIITFNGSKNSREVGFFQTRAIERTFKVQLFPVSISGQPNSSQCRWRTYTGQPPPDHLILREIEAPFLPIETYVIITTLSVALLIAVVVTFAYQIKNMNTKPIIANSMPRFTNMILVGDVSLLMFNLIQPLYRSDSPIDMGVGCMLSYYFYVIGVLMSLHGLGAKFEVSSHLIIGSASAKHHRKKPSRRNFVEVYNLYTRKFAVIVSLLFSVFFLFWFVPGPIRSTKYLLEQPAVSLYDDSYATQHYTYFCDVTESRWATAMIAFLCILLTLVNGRACLFAYISRGQHFDRFLDQKNSARCLISCYAVFLAGTVVAGAIFRSDPRKVQLTLSSVVLICVTLNLFIVFGPKFRRNSEELITKSNSIDAAMGGNFSIGRKDRFTLNFEKPTGLAIKVET